MIERLKRKIDKVNAQVAQASDVEYKEMLLERRAGFEARIRFLQRLGY